MFSFLFYSILEYAAAAVCCLVFRAVIYCHKSQHFISLMGENVIKNCILINHQRSHALTRKNWFSHKIRDCLWFPAAPKVGNQSRPSHFYECDDFLSLRLCLVKFMLYILHRSVQFPDMSEIHHCQHEWCQIRHSTAGSSLRRLKMVSTRQIINSLISFIILMQTDSPWCE